MTQDPDTQSDPLLADLSSEQKAELERKTFLKVGRDVVWLEPDGSARRAPMNRLYYIQTRQGVFRVSRITREVVEV